MKGTCFWCGKWRELEEHHIFPGALRKLSEKYGAKVNLCGECHREGKKAVHKCRATREVIQDYGQRLVMAKQGWTVEEFRAAGFGKNYLLERTSNARPYEEEEDTGGGFFALIDEPVPLPY